MTKTQLKVLWIGIAIFVLMGLFPPTGSSYFPPYDFILTGANVDVCLLCIQWAIVAVVTGGLIYILKFDPELILKIRCRFLSWLSANANTNQKTVQQNNNKPKTD